MQPENSKPTPPQPVKSSYAMPFAAASAPCFARLRADVIECLHAIGAPGSVQVKGIVVQLAEGETWPIPFFAMPEMGDIERMVVEAIQTAGAPLQQKEIARIAKISVRRVQDVTPTLRERGIIVRHPTQGFYLPGMKIMGSDS